jgi:RHS repeat-associated protein
VTYSGHVAPRALPSIDSIGYTYRGEGELDTCTEAKTTASGPATEVTRHFYDGLERRNRTQRYDGYETTFGYDVKGNRTLVRDADGVETAYTYDTKDRLSSATTPMGTTTYSYWEDGLLKTTRYGATMTESRSYDAASRLTVVEAVAPSRVPSLVSRFDYAYDANGNRASQVETRGLAAETTTYGYDEADRLIGVAYPAETHLYQVDAVGNRTGEKRAAAGVVAALTVAAFAALSPAVASAAVERQHNAVDWVTAVVDVKASTTTALSYDANGNRTGEGTKRYAWDIRDTLTRASDGATVLGTYDYDAKLQRVKADTTQGHVEYVLDGKYVLREAGARSRRYHFGEGEALAVTGVGGTSAQDSWLLIDGLGSVVTEANATASAVTARQFDAWGNYRNNTAPTANETRLGYTGHQFDVETGLTYARARYYDSKLGIFLSRDSFEGSINDAPSLHRYTYSHNHPLSYRDPSGRVANLVAAGVGFISGFAIGTAISAGMDLVHGKEVDWTRAVNAGAGAAVQGGLAGLTMGGSLAVQAAVGVSGAVVGGVVRRGLDRDETTVKDVLIDAGGGALGVLGSKGVSAIAARSSKGLMDAAVRESAQELEQQLATTAAAKAAPVVVREATEQVGAVAVASDDVVATASKSEVSAAAHAATESAGKEPQVFVPDLSHVTGKTAVQRNRAIEAIIAEDFPSLQLTHTPEYSPFIRTGVAQQGAGTQIGKTQFSSRAELRDVIVHEELHHRWWSRGLLDHHPAGSESEKLFYETINRYKRFRSLNDSTWSK